MSYVKREDAIRALRVSELKWSTYYTIAAQNAINNIPDADVRENVRGEWEDVEVDYIADITPFPFEAIASMYCPKCGRYHNTIYYYGDPVENANFCPNCGADMRGENDG